MSKDKLQVLHAALYTGDVRCDEDFIERLRRIPPLQPYLDTEHGPRIRLDCIYLDTAGGMCMGELLSQVGELGYLRPRSHSYRCRSERRYCSNGRLDATVSSRCSFLYQYVDYGLRTSDRCRLQSFEQQGMNESHRLSSWPPSILPQVHVDGYGANALRLALSETEFAGLTAKEDDASIRIHACPRQWRCDSIWDNGRGAFRWRPEDQALFTGAKLKINNGCGCAKDDPNHLPNHCRRPDPTEGYTVYVNCVEPFTKRRFHEYRQTLVAEMSQRPAVLVCAET